MHQKRASAFSSRSSHPRRSKRHHRQCGSKTALCPQRYTGLTPRRQAAASKRLVGMRDPSAAQRAIETPRRSQRQGRLLGGGRRKTARLDRGDADARTEESSVGKEGVSTCSFRWSADHDKHKKTTTPTQTE